MDDKIKMQKPKKSLKINLDNNVTCEFLRDQEVNTLLPEVDPFKFERRSLLKEEVKEKRIIKIEKDFKFQKTKPCIPTEDDPLGFITSRIKRVPRQQLTPTP